MVAHGCVHPIAALPLAVAAGCLALAGPAHAAAGPEGEETSRPASDPTPNAIGVSLDAMGRSQRDDVFNATRYAGVTGHLGLGYLRYGQADRHIVRFAAGAGTAANRYDQPLLAIDLDLRYAYQHVVAGDRVRLWLGAQAGGGPRLYQFQHEDADHIYWTTLYDLAPRLSLDTRVQDRRGRAHILEADVELPVLGLLSRPPPTVTYNNDKPSLGYLLKRAHHAPRVASFHNTQVVRTSLGWRLRLSKLVEQKISYDMSYARVSVPATVVMWTHALVYRIDFRFGRKSDAT